AIVKTTGPGYVLVSAGNRISRIVDISSLEEQEEAFRFYPPPNNASVVPSLQKFSMIFPVAIHFVEMERKTAVYQIAALADINIICPETLSGTVSLNLEEVSPESTIQAILQEAQPPHEIKQTGQIFQIVLSEKK
ncbi:MAG: hypothetical protein AABZ60_06000, partial [Planctomycetota bacterium]